MNPVADPTMLTRGRPFPVHCWMFAFGRPMFAFQTSLARRAPKARAKSGQEWPKAAKSGQPASLTLRHPTLDTRPSSRRPRPVIL